jgi:hypothetical protein
VVVAHPGMKRRHKVTAAVAAPVLIGLLTWGLQAWSAYETAARNHEEWQRAVAVCEANGGLWWKGRCKTFPPADWREPK